MNISQGKGSSEFDISHYRRKGTTQNRYYSAPSFIVSTTATALSANILYTIPYVATTVQTINSIAIQVTTLGAGTARLGIYDDDGNLYPDNLIIDAGTVAVNSTGVKTISINQTLNKGLHWLCLVSDIGFSLSRNARPISLLGLPGTDFSSKNLSYQVAFAFAALPATFPAGASFSTSTIPAIAIRLIP